MTIISDMPIEEAVSAHATGEAPKRAKTRTPITRRAVLAGGAMALTSVVAYAVVPRRSEHRLEHAKLGNLVSRQIGPWHAVDPVGIIDTDETLQHTDGYDQLLKRVYVAPGLPTIMLLIAYGSTQGGTLQLHRPETCYPGQGFAMNQQAETDFHFRPDKPVQARRFTAVRGNRIERLVYWTRIGDDFPRNSAQEYSAILASVLHGAVPDGVLVRISTIGPNIARSDTALTRFAREMIANTTPLGRQVLIGFPMNIRHKLIAFSPVARATPYQHGIYAAAEM